MDRMGKVESPMKCRCVALITLCALGTGAVFAQQDYPSKPIRIVTGGTGGSIAQPMGSLAVGDPGGSSELSDLQIAPGDASFGCGR